MKKRNAFTLAEVLITLGIIGVVAAVTLPALVQKYKEKQRVTQVKKAYTVLSQAFQMVKLEYGDPRDWSIATTDTGNRDESGNAIYDASGQNWLRDVFAKHIKNSKGKSKHTFRGGYYSLDGRYYNSDEESMIEGDKYIYLSDGTIIGFGWVYEKCDNENVSCGDIVVYLPERTAKLGVSVFYFYFTPDGIVPYGNIKQTQRPFEDYCDRKNKKGLSQQSQGRSCTAWVLYNENMDYLHCDDLSWDGKTKCSK